MSSKHRIRVVSHPVDDIDRHWVSFPVCWHVMRGNELLTCSLEWGYALEYAYHSAWVVKSA
ncbi:hypothetical protein GOALK_093_00670 [Gordonia alkanivorans NBRC 16433]|uniref:Uncharacterized protein n=2 Tax=root TaxID=1 RepID=A0A159B6E3_9CAUD|nr:hypothetical protein BOX05_gp44 [Gordonia phage GAL1]AKJ72059.1 hypothetical protein GAL1_44 [Gordonia phage GAL1]GAA13879.1 hypothetical protein GOALK_093_00670 [Gordonia alkanivorans NBRC 16433]